MQNTIPILDVLIRPSVTQRIEICTLALKHLPSTNQKKKKLLFSMKLRPVTFDRSVLIFFYLWHILCTYSSGVRDGFIADNYNNHE